MHSLILYFERRPCPVSRASCLHMDRLKEISDIVVEMHL